MSILDNKGTKFFQQILPTSPCYFWGMNLGLLKIHFSKDKIIKSCQQSDESLIFNHKILTHLKKEPSSSSADSSSDAINCRCPGLSSHLEELFNNKQFSSDVILNIYRREFPAHKNILTARSEVFADMFKHPMREQSNKLVYCCFYLK